MNKGSFIVLEGGEGAGKSTQLARVKEMYGERVLITREPGGSPYAEEIRNIILKSAYAGQADAKTHFALFWASRADHLKNTVLPALQKGITVISDRFDSSTFAYQIYGQQAKELEEFFWQMRDFYLNEIKPDIYLYMDVNVEKGLSRKYAQGGDEVNHFEERKLDFHHRMREGYLNFFKKVPHHIIDANPPVEIVSASFDSVIKSLIG